MVAVTAVVVVLLVVIVALVAALGVLVRSRQGLVEQVRTRAEAAAGPPPGGRGPGAPVAARRPFPGGPRPVQGPPTAPDHEVRTGVSTPPQGFAAQVPPDAALTPPEGIPVQDPDAPGTRADRA